MTGCRECFALARALVWLTIVSLLLSSVQPLRVQASAAPSMAAATPQVRLSSAFIHGGGTLVVTATNLQPGTSYQVGLLTGSTLRGGYLTTASDSGGRLFAQLVIAEGAPSETTTVGVAGERGILVASSTPLEIRTAISLLPTPASGKPGAVVQLVVRGLEAGTLRVDLDGQAVIGPLAVLEGAYTGSFIIPQHGAAAIPGAKLTATNLIDQGVIGRASIPFDILAPDSSPQPQLSELVISPDPLMAGEPFTLTGTIWPLPAELSLLSASSALDPSTAQSALQGMLAASVVDIVTLDKSPVSTQITSLDASGHFTAQGTAPAKHLGNLVLLNSTSQFEITLAGKGFTVKGTAGFTGPMDLEIMIEPVDTNGNPLIGVKTSLTEIPPFMALSGSSAIPAGNKYNLQEMFCDKGQWIHQSLPGSGLAEYFGSGADIPIHTNPVNQLMLGSDLYGKAPEVVEAFTPGTALHSLASLPANSPAWLGGGFDPTTFIDFAAWEKYDTYADGRAINYSAKGDEDWNSGDPLRIFHQKVWFHRKNSLEYPYGLYNTQGEKIAENTITYIFEYIDPGLASPPLAFLMDQAIDLGLTTMNGNDLQAFGGFFDLAPINGDPSVNLSLFPTSIQIRFGWNSTKYGKLNKVVDLFLDGAPLGTAEMTGGLETPLCIQIQKSPGVANSNPSPSDFSEYRLNIPYPTHLAAGMRRLGISFKMDNGATITREIALRSDNLPDWFLQGQNFSARAITYDYDNKIVTFGGKQLDPSLHQYGAGDGEASGDVPNVGYVQNQVKADTFVEQVYIPAKTLASEAVFTGVKATTKAPDTQALSNKPTSPSTKGEANDVVYIDVPNILLAYVAMPLYVIAFEDPFGGAIVNGTSGALMQAYATMNIKGHISPSETDLTFSPHAQVDMQIWLNINVLYGFLGKAEMAFYPSFGLTMPVRFRVPTPDDQSTPISIEGVCFTFRGDVHFYFGFLCAPYLGCAVKHKGTQNIYNGRFPSGCVSGSSGLGAQRFQLEGPFPPADAAPESIAQELPEPLMTHVELFTSGKGNAAALFEEDGGSLKISQFIDGAWTSPVEIEKARTNDSATIAPLSSSRNLALWITTAYATDAELQAQPISVGAQSMYVKSLLLDSSDSIQPVAAAVSVTPPSSGDGQVALGSCPEDQAGCPTGGEATAAWLRMKTADAVNGGARLMYATYSAATNTWGSEQTVPQPTGASDSQAQVIYNTAGDPTIFFVRDVDGDLETSADRYLYQVAPGDATATPVVGIPGSLYEFTLASAPDGQIHIAFTRVEGDQVGLMDNRHPLYVGQAESGVFTAEMVKDQYQRAVFAESPSLQFSGEGEAMLTYRALGMGVDSQGLYTPYPVDSLGVTYRTGEMAQISVKFGQSIQFPKYLTQDGAVNWGIDSTVDQITGKIISTGIHTDALSLPKLLAAQGQSQALENKPDAQAQTLAQPMSTGVVDTGILFAVSPDQPQFAIETAEPTNYDAQGAGGIANLGIRNQGTAFAGTGENAVKIIATWDAPYGQGPIAGQGVLETLGAGEWVDYPLAVTPPVSPDLAHTLYVTISPPSSVQESTLADNSVTLTMGGIPEPQQVLVSIQDLNNHAALATWQAVNDTRVTGYRVYRAPTTGASADVFVLLGTTQSLDWLDATAGAGLSYRYAVAALSLSGVESPLSQPAQGNLPYHMVYLPAIRK